MSDLPKDTFDIVENESNAWWTLQGTPSTFKRLFDIIVSISLLTILSPVLLLLMILVKYDGGPTLFSQTRVGRNSIRFRCLKFRTMSIDAERRLAILLASSEEFAQEWENTRKLKYDPRVTRLGMIMRRSSLDELPQLWNVLCGDMSLVGPRPIVEEEIPLYGTLISYYYKMRPGITGLWQVTGRSDTSYKRRVALDAWYVRNWSPIKDAAILVATFSAVMRARGAR